MLKCLPICLALLVMSSPLSAQVVINAKMRSLSPSVFGPAISGLKSESCA